MSSHGIKADVYCDSWQSATSDSNRRFEFPVLPRTGEYVFIHEDDLLGVDADGSILPDNIGGLYLVTKVIHEYLGTLNLAGALAIVSLEKAGDKIGL